MNDKILKDYPDREEVIEYVKQRMLDYIQHDNIKPNFSAITREVLSKWPDVKPGVEDPFEAMRWSVRIIYQRNFPDGELVDESIKQAKKAQRYQDINRVERKAFRESSRIENALTEYNRKLIEILKEDGLKTEVHVHDDSDEETKLILQLSDLHLNELVDTGYNRYDYKVASQRLELLANETIKLGKLYNSKSLVITVLGDLLNSDRRLDELLVMATNRAKATQLAVVLLKQFILHLNQFFNITLTGITGNESRAKKDLSFVDIVATDNYDYTIYDQLKLIFEAAKTQGVVFTPMQANESLLTIYDKNFLLLHGHQIGPKGDMQKAIQQITGKHTNMGRVIHYTLCGHIHSAYICDYFARNSSLVGSNPYSFEALQYISRASQNVHIVYPEDRVHSMKIDLQNYDGVNGYPIEHDVDAYNAKSLAKTKNATTIFEVVI